MFVAMKLPQKVHNHDNTNWFRGKLTTVSIYDDLGSTLKAAKTVKLRLKKQPYFLCLCLILFVSPISLLSYFPLSLISLLLIQNCQIWSKLSKVSNWVRIFKSGENTESALNCEIISILSEYVCYCACVCLLIGHVMCAGFSNQFSGINWTITSLKDNPAEVERYYLLQVKVTHWMTRSPIESLLGRLKQNNLFCSFCVNVFSTC